jgi:hypothetical protein
MKPKTLIFVEQYIDNDPPKNCYWRGITAYLTEESDEWIFRINFEPKKSKFGEPDFFYVRTSLGVDGGEVNQKLFGKKFHTKEDVKKFTQEIFNEYVNSLCE